jgi:hypothetical protein
MLWPLNCRVSLSHGVYFCFFFSLQFCTFRWNFCVRIVGALFFNYFSHIFHQVSVITQCARQWGEGECVSVRNFLKNGMGACRYLNCFFFNDRGVCVMIGSRTTPLDLGDFVAFCDGVASWQTPDPQLKMMFQQVITHFVCLTYEGYSLNLIFVDDDILSTKPTMVMLSYSYCLTTSIRELSPFWFFEKNSFPSAFLLRLFI